MMNAWVNGELVSCGNGCVGSENVGYFGTVTTLTAALASAAAGWYTSQKEGGIFLGKMPVMLGGNGAFGVLGLIVLLLPVEAFYGSFAMLLPLYMLQGLGRGIFESTNKAVIADYCPGARAEAGFASFVILSGSASTLMFFLIPILKAPRSCIATDPTDPDNLSACDTALGMDLDGAACGAKPNCAYDAGMSDINYGQPVFASMVVVFSLLALVLFPMSHKAALLENGGEATRPALLGKDVDSCVAANDEGYAPPVMADPEEPQAS